MIEVCLEVIVVLVLIVDIDECGVDVGDFECFVFSIGIMFE